MQPETDAPMSLKPGGETFRDRVVHPLMFRAYMLAKMPVLGVTGAYLTDIDTRRSEMVLPFGWSTKNLFGRMFDSAVVAAAETTSLSLLVLHVRNQDVALRAELVEMTTEVHASPTSDLHIRCEDGHHYADFVRRASEEAPLTRTFEVCAKTSDGRTCHEIAFQWRLRHRE